MHKQEAKRKVELGMARGFCYLTAHTPVVYFLQQGPPPQPLKTVLPTGDHMWKFQRKQLKLKLPHYVNRTTQ